MEEKNWERNLEISRRKRKTVKSGNEGKNLEKKKQ